MGVFVLVLVLTVAVDAIDPPGTPIGRSALDACDDAREKGDDATFDAAVKRAEDAVEAEPDDPVAQLALFCTLGERMRHRGVSLRSLIELRRLRRTIDRVLALAPNYTDALVGKANLLLDAPAFFGGDVPEAERLLRRALALDPTDIGARLDLARTLDRRGERAAAIGEARRALGEAQAAGDAAAIARAQEVLAEVEH